MEGLAVHQREAPLGLGEALLDLRQARALGLLGLEGGRLLLELLAQARVQLVHPRQVLVAEGRGRALPVREGGEVPGEALVLALQRVVVVLEPLGEGAGVGVLALERLVRGLERLVRLGGLGVGGGGRGVLEEEVLVLALEGAVPDLQEELPVELGLEVLLRAQEGVVLGRA